jgi:hypothetical protein
MNQLFHPQGWDFHLKTVVAFGTAVRLRGFFGVRHTLTLSNAFIISTDKKKKQEDVLYLTDPAGLRTILTKEHGDIYDEPPMIIE